MSLLTDNHLAATGVDGLDHILHGGFQQGQLHLLRGPSGAGKTTAALQFLLAGARRGEKCLYIGTNEGSPEIRQLAESHGWSLDGVAVHHHDGDGVSGQTVLHPAEAELPRTIDAICTAADEITPQRIVVDSLGEIQMLSHEREWYIRQLLRLRAHFDEYGSTVLLTETPSAVGEAAGSLVSSIVEMQTESPPYGPDRRRLHIAKVRARPFSTGWHDYRITTGGIEVYPRLIAAEHRRPGTAQVIPSGVEGLDVLLGGGLGGGLDRGTTTLLRGPPGAGKSLVAVQFAISAAQRGEPAVVYLFDERVRTLVEGAHALGLDLDQHLDSSAIQIRQVDAAEFSAGEFNHRVKEAVERGVRHVVIDSLGGYRYAMGEEQSLPMHLRELLSYLEQQMITICIVAEETPHGLDDRLMISCLADTVLAFDLRLSGERIRRTIRVQKRRCGPHESAAHDLVLRAGGAVVGEPLSNGHAAAVDEHPSTHGAHDVPELQARQ